MPSIVHLAPRLDIASGQAGTISATAIGLIVGLGIIPVIILVWVVSWLFWCYPYDRSCCCTRRKKQQTDEEKPRGPFHKTGRSLDSLHEKSTYPMPARPPTNYRTESGNSNRLTKTDPRLSITSTDTTTIMQEPKRFV